MIAILQMTCPLVAPPAELPRQFEQVLQDFDLRIEQTDSTTRRHGLGLLVTRTWTLTVDGAR